MTTPLCALADVKTYLSQSGTGNDALLNRLITAASAFIESWLSRTIAVASYTDTFNGNGQRVLYLPNRPVQSIVSLAIDTFSIAAAPDSTSWGYSFDEERIYLRGYEFTVGVQNVAVEYTAGLSSNAPADVPADLTQACIELIALKYRRMGDEGQASKHLGSETVSFVTADMPKPVATLLQQYKNVVPA